MALPSVHIICGFAGGDGNQLTSKQALLRLPQWSEEPASGVATQPATDNVGMKPIFRITNTVDVYLSIGKTPNATASPRFALRASDAPHDIYVEPGDKAAWVAA